MSKNEFDKLLDEYSTEGYFLYAGKEDDSDLEKWRNVETANKYLERFWLDCEEYKNIWKPIQQKLYSSATSTFPNLLFPKDVYVFLRVAGVSLTKENLEEIKKLMKELGESHFVLIQNNHGIENANSLPNFKMKYPVSISWSELMSGGFISTALFEMWHNEYFIFGSSGAWARYVANEYELPIDLLAVKDFLIKSVNSNFCNSQADSKELEKIVPESYKNFYRVYY